MLKFTVLTMLVVGLVVANAARRNMGVGRSQSKAAKNIDEGEPSPSEESSHGSCGGCTFPWLDWHNNTHYACTDFDGDYNYKL